MCSSDLYLYINHCHHHLSHEKYFYNTTKHFYFWVFSWGFKFWAIDAFRYHHCLSFLPKKNQKIKKKKKKKRKKKREKEKESGDIPNQSINHWCLTHLSCISEGLYGWVNVVLIQVGCYCYELGLPLNFLHLIHIPHISKRAVCLYIAIRLYYHWA